MRIDIRDLAEVVGKGLADSDDETQAKLLNFFGQELAIKCREKLDTQLCYISDKLNKHGGDLVLELAAYVELRRAATLKACK